MTAARPGWREVSGSSLPTSLSGSITSFLPFICIRDRSRFAAQHIVAKDNAENLSLFSFSYLSLSLFFLFFFFYFFFSFFFFFFVVVMIVLNQYFPLAMIQLTIGRLFKKLNKSARNNNNANNNNNEYLERLIRTAPKRLHVLYKYTLSKFNANNMNARARAQTHTHTHARTHIHTDPHTRSASTSERQRSNQASVKNVDCHGTPQNGGYRKQCCRACVQL